MFSMIPSRLRPVLSRARVYSKRNISNGRSKVGFIGLGNMGMPMMENLVKGGKLDVFAYDADEAKLKIAQDKGATPCKSLDSIADQANFILTMLPGNQHVKSTYETINNLATVSKDCICVDMSTVDPNVSKEVSKDFVSKNIGFIDAPVSGGVGGAQNGTLTFMCGGKKETFEKAKDQVLSFMGQSFVHCGEEVGAGEAAKLSNNLLLAISMAGVSEAMSLGVKLGVDPHVLANVLNTSTGRCWSSDAYNPYPGVTPSSPSNRDYEGGFAVDLMLKDLNLALDAATAVSMKTLLGRSIADIYTSLSKDDGLGKKDFSVVIKKLDL